VSDGDNRRYGSSTAAVRGSLGGEHCTLYPSKTGTPLVTYIYPNGHQFPQEALPVIVKFFKEHVKP